VEVREGAERVEVVKVVEELGEGVLVAVAMVEAATMVACWAACSVEASQVGLVVVVEGEMEVHWAVDLREEGSHSCR